MRLFLTAVFLFAALQLHSFDCIDKITRSSRPDPCKSGPYFYGEYLFLQATMEPVVQTAKVKDFDVENFVLGKADAITLDFPWDSGFRVGVGYSLKYNQWNLDLSWMRYQASSSTTVRSSTPDLLFIPDDFSIPREGDFLVSRFSKGRWNLHFDSIDCNLGRMFYLGSSFIVRPHFGLKALWNDQNLKFNASDLFIKFDFLNELAFFAYTAEIISKGKFWGVGPTIGISGKWVWVDSFGLFGKLRGGLIWGAFRNQLQEFIANADLSGTIPIFPPFSFDAPSTIKGSSRVKPMIEMQIGLDWIHYYKNHRIFTAFYAGFEMQHYWSQNILNRGEYFNLKGLVVSGILGF